MRVRKFQPTFIRRSGAFTLIEILVVLVIVGILMAVAFLSFGILGDNRSLDREARRLASLIELVSDEATTQGRDFGLEFLSGGYRFVEYDPLIDQWFEVIGDEYLQQRALDEGVEFELFLEDRKIQLHTEAQDIEREEEEDDEDENDTVNRYQAPRRDLTDDYLPHVLILSSGDITPFDLRFIRFADRSELLLTMELTGEMKIGEDDDEVR
jgi:general secretion pathway protein H